MCKSSQAGGSSPSRPPQGRAEAHAPPIPVRSHGNLLASVERIAEASARPAELSRLFTTVVDETGALMGASVTVGLLDADEVLELKAGCGILASWEGAHLPVEGSFSGSALTLRAPKRTHDLSAEPVAYPLERQAGSGPAAVAPLMSGKEVLGVLLAVRGTADAPFQDVDLRNLEHLGRIVASGLAGARRFAEARGSRIGVDAWRREQDLRSQLGWYKTISNGSGAAYLRLDSVSEQMIWSGAADRLLGLPPEEPISVDTWLERVHPEDRERVARVLRAPGAESEHLLFRVRGERDSGRPLQLEIHCQDLSDRSNRIGILREIADEATPGALSPRVLLQAVRHELNNPLAIIVGELQLLQRDSVLKDVPSVAQAMDSVNKAALRLSDLAGRLATAERQMESLFITEEGGVGVPPPL